MGRRRTPEAWVEAIRAFGGEATAHDLLPPGRGGWRFCKALARAVDLGLVVPAMAYRPDPRGRLSLQRVFRCAAVVSA